MIYKHEDVIETLMRAPFRNSGDLPIKNKVLYLSLEMNSDESAEALPAITDLLENRSAYGQESFKDSLIIVSGWEEVTPDLFTDESIKKTKSKLIDFTKNDGLDEMIEAAYKALKEVAYDMSKVQQKNIALDDGPGI